MYQLPPSNDRQSYFLKEREKLSNGQRGKITEHLQHTLKKIRDKIKSLGKSCPKTAFWDFGQTVTVYIYQNIEVNTEKVADSESA